mgnify:CR=1 FL=1
MPVDGFTLQLSGMAEVRAALAGVDRVLVIGVTTGSVLANPVTAETSA